MSVVRMFGPLQVEHGGRHLGPGDLGGPRPRQVLEILLSERGRRVTKQRMAELLWGEALPQNPTAALETYVSILRKHLQGGATGADPLVVTEPGGYRLASDRLEVDLDRFDRLAARGTRHHLEEALRLVRGEVLEHEPYATWAVRLREEYREQHLKVLVAAAEAALAEGDAGGALERAETAISLDPVREQAYRLAMAASYLLGRQEQALRTFERARVALREELGVDPMPQTLRLHTAILRHEDPLRLLTAVPAVRTPSEGGRVGELPFLGRMDELGTLTSAAEQALTGAGGVIIVEGEAGIGKSRLLGELARRLPVPIGRAKCFPLDHQLPFVPLAVAVRDLGVVDPSQASRLPALGEILPELGAMGNSGLPPEAARRRALESLAALLAERAPVALLIDDLQWADASTLAALAYVARRGQAPVVIAGAFRSEEVPAGDPLRELPASVRVELGPLTAGDVTPLGVPGLYETTGGHPLFVAERFRAISEGHPERLPQTLRDTILARCRASGAEAHRLLAVASVLGRDFDVAVLAQLVDGDALELSEQLELLCERRLLRATETGFDFRHDLIREALFTGLSPARRRLLHARALIALEAAGAPPGDLAHHAEEAGAFQQAVRHAIAAGDDARARWANVEAAAHYETARRIAAEHPDMLEASAHEALLVRLAQVLATLGRPEEATRAAEQARASALERGDDRSLYDALETLANVRHRGASAPSEAVPHARAALEVAERLADDAKLVRARVLVANPAISLGRLDEAMTHYQSALDLARRTGQDAGAFPLARVGLIHHLRAQETQALDWCERAETVALQQHDEETLLMSRWIRALSLAALGRYGQAWAMLDSFSGIGKGEEVFWHARVPNTYGHILADLCLHDRALERDVESVEAARASPSRPVREAELQSLVNVASDRLALGDLSGARAAAASVREQAPEVEYSRYRYLSRLHAIEAEVALAESDAEASLSAAERCLDMAATYGQPRYEVRGRLARGRALNALGATQEGRRQVRAAARLADRLGFPGLSWRAWWAAYELGGTRHDLRLAQEGVRRVAAGAGDLAGAFLAAVPVPP